MAFRIPKIPPSKQKEVDCTGLPVLPFSRFSNKEEIGRGSYGAVFTAEDQNSEKVVIKKLLGQDREEQKGFVKEARILHALENPNIVQFKGICTSRVTGIFEI